MANNCGTCNNWDKLEPVAWYNAYAMRNVRGETYEELEARMVKTNSLYGVCHGVASLPEDPYDGPPITPPLAVTRDGSDYMATLFTQASFGCVLWAEKEKSDA